MLYELFVNVDRVGKAVLAGNREDAMQHQKQLTDDLNNTDRDGYLPHYRISWDRILNVAEIALILGDPAAALHMLHDGTTNQYLCKIIDTQPLTFSKWWDLAMAALLMDWTNRIGASFSLMGDRLVFQYNEQRHETTYDTVEAKFLHEAIADVTKIHSGFVPLRQALIRITGQEVELVRIMIRLTTHNLI